MTTMHRAPVTLVALLCLGIVACSDDSSPGTADAALEAGVDGPRSDAGSPDGASATDGLAADAPAQVDAATADQSAPCSGLATRPCRVAHGSGSQSRACQGGVYSYWQTCQPASCDSGYTLVGRFCRAQTAPVWFDARVIAQNTPHDVARPMAAGVYDVIANKSFVVFLGNGHVPSIAALDHATDVWSAPAGVGHAMSGSSAKYAYPQLVQTPDGHLHVFYARHTTELWHARSTAPRSIATWQETQLTLLADENGDGQGDGKIKPSYPKPLVDARGQIFLFFRHMISDPVRPTYYSKSSDGGQTWSLARGLITPHLVDASIAPHTLDEVYLGQITPALRRLDEPERFHFVWILAGGPTHNDYHKNIYHGVFRPDTERFYGSDGTDLGPVADQAEIDAHCLVEDTGPAATTPMTPNYANTVAADDSGRALVNGGHLFGGGQWSQPAASGLDSTDGLNVAWRQGVWVGYSRAVRIQESADSGATWTTVANAVMPNKPGGVAVRDILVTEPAHPAARVWLKEQSSSAQTNKIGVAGHGSTKTAQKLLLVPTALVGANTTVGLAAVIVDEENARITSATTAVTFSVYGPATLSGSATSSASAGVASATLKTGSQAGTITVQAEAQGLEMATLQLVLP